jgi:formylmethanofuran dehydrogenase subunit C
MVEQPNWMNVRKFVETEYQCEVTDMHIAPIKVKGYALTATWKVTGTAYRHGRKMLVGGSVNAHNFSGVEVFDAATDDPFTDLRIWEG